MLPASEENFSELSTLGFHNKKIQVISCFSLHVILTFGRNYHITFPYKSTQLINMSGWPSGLRGYSLVLVHLWVCWFKSLSWQYFIKNLENQPSCINTNINSWYFIVRMAEWSKALPYCCSQQLLFWVQIPVVTMNNKYPWQIFDAYSKNYKIFKNNK